MSTLTTHANDSAATDAREPSPKALETAYTQEFAPNLAMWRYMVASAWQDALKRGDIETVCVRGEHLRHGDKFTQKYTGFLYRLLEPVKSGIAHDEREYTIWRVMSLNTPKAAVLEETIYDVVDYRVVKG